MRSLILTLIVAFATTRKVSRQSHPVDTCIVQRCHEEVLNCKSHPGCLQTLKMCMSQDPHGDTECLDHNVHALHLWTKFSAECEGASSRLVAHVDVQAMNQCMKQYCTPQLEDCEKYPLCQQTINNCAAQAHKKNDPQTIQTFGTCVASNYFAKVLWNCITQNCMHLQESLLETLPR